MATYDEWLYAYSAFYDAIPNTSHLACPNCGHKTLRLVYTGDPDRMIGYGHFWCDTCLQGIGISRAPIPDGATMQDIREAPENRLPKVPDFRLAV